jgi:hypothetical protein
MGENKKNSPVFIKFHFVLWQLNKTGEKKQGKKS